MTTVHSQGSQVYNSLSMADREPVEAVASLIGSRVWIRDRRQKSHHSIMYHFEATSFQAVQLLNKVMPFLRCKRHQAQMACQLHDLKQSPKRFKTVTGGKNGTRVLSDNHLAKCENIYLKMIRRPYQRRAA